MVDYQTMSAIKVTHRGHRYSLINSTIREGGKPDLIISNQPRGGGEKQNKKKVLIRQEAQFPIETQLTEATGFLAIILVRTAADALTGSAKTTKSGHYR